MACRSAGAALLLWLFTHSAAFAQAPGAPTAADTPPVATLSLEDLLKLEVDTVVTASKFVQNTSEAPASVTVITAEEIRLQGYRTLSDVLRSVRGMYVSYDRNYSYIGVRGFARPGDYNTRVLLMIDGHRLNDGIYDMALIGTELPLDLELVDRIEVIRGPSSSLYGASAFFGVVNVITRPAGGVDHGELSFEGGGLETMRVRGAVAGHSAAGVEGLFSVTGYRSSGQRRLYFPEFDSPDTNHGIARNLDSDAVASAFAHVTYRGFSAEATYGSRSKDVPTGSYDTLFDLPGTMTVDSRGYLTLGYNGRLRGWAVNANAGYDRYDYVGHYRYDAGDGVDYLPYDDSALAETLSGDVTLARRFARHTVTVGTDWRWNLTQNQHAQDWTGVLIDVRGRSLTAGTYVQDEFLVAPRVRVNAGLRYDHYESFGGTLNPRFGVIVTPRDKSVLKILAGRAFRAPNDYELYYFNRSTMPALNPEAIWTGEVAWEQQVAAHLTASASVYQYRVESLIDQIATDATPDGIAFVNNSAVTARGLELEAQGSWGRGLRVRAAHAFGRASDDGSRERLSNSPANLTTINVIAPIGASGIVAAANVQIIGARRTLLGERVEAAGVTNLTISRRQVAKRVDVACSVYNLFDVEHPDPGASEHRQQTIPQDGRTALLRLTWRF
jgi:outer membrane receptor for ferrienterochelin and colicins